MIIKKLLLVTSVRKETSNSAIIKLKKNTLFPMKTGGWNQSCYHLIEIDNNNNDKSI